MEEINGVKWVQHRGPVETHHNEIVFDYIGETDWGFSFECDTEGNIDVDALPEAAQENLAKCRDKSNPLGVESKGHKSWTSEYIQPGIIICNECGEEVYLHDAMDNDCPKCDRIYNMSGQEVRCHARDIDYLDAGEEY